MVALLQGCYRLTLISCDIRTNWRRNTKIICYLYHNIIFKLTLLTESTTKIGTTTRSNSKGQDKHNISDINRSKNENAQLTKMPPNEAL